MYNIIGSGRIIDFNEENATCRVRLLDNDGLPTGKVYAKVKMAHDVSEPALPELRKQIQQEVARGSPQLSTWSDHELDTAARQNLYYNSHHPVTIK